MGINELKYKAKIITLNQCPNGNCEESLRDGYRFIKDNVESHSFMPVAVLDPSRILSPDIICSGYATSMFKDEESARIRYEKLKKSNKKIHKKLGNKLAYGKLQPEFGLCSDISSSGHFDFYEYLNSNLENHFNLIGNL